jgi:hypothetical protein
MDRGRFPEDSGIGPDRARAQAGNGLARAAMDAATHACSMQAYLQAMAKASVRLAPDARAAQLRGAHLQAARGLRSAVELWMKGIGANGERLRTLMLAGVDLQSTLEASDDPEAVRQAYSTYHVSVLTVLCTVLPMHARNLSMLSIRLRCEGGARSRLFAALRAADVIDAIAKAYADFTAAVESEAGKVFPGDPGAPVPHQAQAIAQVLMLANMGGAPDWEDSAEAG